MQLVTIRANDKYTYFLETILFQIWILRRIHIKKLFQDADSNGLFSYPVHDFETNFSMQVQF